MYLSFQNNQKKLKKINLTEINNFDVFSKKYIRLLSHFINNLGDWASATVGAGASATVGVIPVTDLGRTPGILPLRTGTTATGSARIGMLNGNFSSLILLGFHKWLFETSISLLALSDAANAFTVVFGFMDSATIVSVVDGAYFRYTHSVNNGNWQCVVRNNSIETVTNTTVSPTFASYQSITLIVAENEVNFYIDGIEVAFMPNIPVGAGRQTSICLNVVATSGATSKGVNLDYLELVGELL